MNDKQQEVINYLNNNNIFESLWPFASGGKIPASTKFSTIKDVPLRKEIRSDVKKLRKELNLPYYGSMTWGDYTILQPKYPLLQQMTLDRIMDNDIEAISIKLGPTYPGSKEALFSVDLDCKVNIITGEVYPDEIRQSFLDKIVKALFNMYGPTLVTSSRSNGRHIIYKTDIKQTTRITNSTNELMGLYWNDDPGYLFAVDYKTSDSWYNSHHTTLYGEGKYEDYFGIIENKPIRMVPGLQTNSIIRNLLNLGLIKYSKELADKRRIIKREKSLESRLNGVDQ